MRFSDLRGCRGDMPRGDRDREGQNSKNVTIIRARAKESEGERDRTLKQTWEWEWSARCDQSRTPCDFVRPALFLYHAPIRRDATNCFRIRLRSIRSLSFFMQKQKLTIFLSRYIEFYKYSPTLLFSQHNPPAVSIVRDSIVEFVIIKLLNSHLLQLVLPFGNCSTPSLFFRMTERYVIYVEK